MLATSLWDDIARCMKDRCSPREPRESKVEVAERSVAA